MPRVRELLRNYFEILEEGRLSKFNISKYISVNYKENDKMKKLWKTHNQALKEEKIQENKPNQSLLDLKISIAKRIFEKCNFCERRCNANREKKAGVCRVKQARISSEFLHMGEERELIPSHTIFFSGCTFNCVFCQNWDISQKITGLYIEPEKLAQIIECRKNQGANNINWVGGDPTPNIVYILETMKKIQSNIPQIFNSNMYCSNETMNLLDGVIDLYLTDFKYGNNKCAKRFSNIGNYFKIIPRNHLKAYSNGELIIRHLVMPNHIECCSKPILKWISENISDAVVNIMAQYRPEYKAINYEDISKKISLEEVFLVKEYAEKLDLNLI